VLSLRLVLINLGDRIELILGKAYYELLKTLEFTVHNQESLVSVCIDIHTEWGILRNNEFRSIIFDSLRKDNALQLALLLGLSHSGSPYKALREKKFRKNSKQEEHLFNFFGLSKPEENAEVLTSKTTEIVKAKHGLFDHQRDALKEIEQILDYEGGRVVLHMPTGSGKTRTAMNLASKHLIKEGPTTILWLAHSEELCEQAAEEFEKAWSYLGNRDVNIRRFYRSHKWEETKDGIIIAGLQKLWSYVKNNNTDLFFAAENISLVIFDEAHQSISETYKLPVEIITTKNYGCKFLGLTATPGRTWDDIDKDKILSDFYNNRKVSLKVKGYDSPIKYLVDQKYLSNTIFQSLEVNTQLNLSEEDIKSIERNTEYSNVILNELSNNGERNSIILEKIGNLIDLKHERILVFAMSVKHAIMINAMLKNSGINSEVITGETDVVKRRNSISKFKEVGGEAMVLCNYGVLTTGFDAPLTSAAVITRPTKSLVLYSQMVGRAIRGPLVKGTAEAEIWTVVDINLPGFGNLIEAFNNWEDVWRD